MDKDFIAAALDYHRSPTRGKIAVVPTKGLTNQRDLALAYSPGVAAACDAIVADPADAQEYTSRGNLVAVVTNGTAVLGLGNIGPLAAKPVMEGKGCLFKKFANIDVFDIELAENDPDKLIDMIAALEPTLGGVNLEDIKAPECFYIEQKLRERMNIPVFHDDQHGTAIVVLAALLGATKVLERDMHNLKVVVSGAGAAGVACANILLAAGVKDIVVLDSKGIVSRDRDNLNEFKEELAGRTNPRELRGGPAEALAGADVFIGVSAGTIAEELIATMAPDPIIFAMSNPDPEIRPEVAAKYAAIVATGRSDFPNQINNVLAFPGIFRGALDVRAKAINEEMKMAAAEAIADLIDETELDEQHVITSPFDPRVAPQVAAAVAGAAIKTGVARLTDITPEQVAEHTRQLLADERASEA